MDLQVLISINDYQYELHAINNTLNTYDLSRVELYLGGLPEANSIISGLYPSLRPINTFRGCIRNVLSNGYYLDMSQSLSSINSNYGECSCSITNSCTTRNRLFDIIIPWYIWLILALLPFIIISVIGTTLLIFITRKIRSKQASDASSDDRRENKIDDK